MIFRFRWAFVCALLWDPENASSRAESLGPLQVRGLQSVARAIGEVKTRTELLTVVTDRIAIEEEDEVLYAIAGVLGARAPAAFSSPQTPSLLSLSRFEEGDESLLRLEEGDESLLRYVGFSLEIFSCVVPLS